MTKTLRFLLLWVPSILVIAIMLLLAFIKFEYGRGTPYPDTGADSQQAAKQPEPFLRLDYPPGNLAVAPNGHVYFNYHPFARADRFAEATVFEWADGQISPFPSLEAQKAFRGTFGMTIDQQNRIWFVEPANLDFDHTRLWAFDLQTRRQMMFFEFPGKAAQFAQDLRVTADGKYILLADTGLFRFTAPKLYVFSVVDQTFRVALDGAPCLRPEDWVMQTPYGPYRLGWGLLNFAVGLDGIEISPEQKWLYLAAMTSSRLCRVPLAAVLDPSGQPAALAQQVEALGQKPLSDGITLDQTGKVILTDVEHGGLTAFDLTSKKTTTLTRSKGIIWADGVVTGPDGALYFTDSAIPAYIGPLGGPPDRSTLQAHQPYYIYRLRQ